MSSHSSRRFSESRENALTEAALKRIAYTEASRAAKAAIKAPAVQSAQAKQAAAAKAASDARSAAGRVAAAMKIANETNRSTTNVARAVANMSMQHSTTKQVETRIADHFSRGHSTRDAHPGFLSRSGIRHGRIRHVGTRHTSQGVCSTYEGTERLLEIDILDNVDPGYIFDAVQLNPTAFGIVLPQFAAPFSKFLFKKVDIEVVPEAAFTNVNASGSIYYGANFDPTAPLPTGSTGVSGVATWAPNDMIVANKESKSRRLPLRLDQGSQIPLFVRQGGDVSLESQAQVVAMAGTHLGTTGTAFSYGEWFIHYTVEMYQLNTTNEDIAGGMLYANTGALRSFPSGGINLQLLDYYGNGSIVNIHDGSVGVNISLPTDGTFFLEVATQNTLDANTSVRAQLLAYAISGSPLLPLFGSVYNTPPNFKPGFITGCGIIGQYSNAVMTGSPLEPNTGSITSAWMFTAVAGQALFLTAPITAGVLGSTPPQQLELRIMKIDSIYHADAVLPQIEPSLIAAGTTLRNRRSRFHVERAMAAASSMSAADTLAVTAYLNGHRDEIDPATFNLLIDNLELPLQKRSTTSAVVDMKAVAKWALTTLGPIVAARALKWILDRLK